MAAEREKSRGPSAVGLAIREPRGSSGAAGSGECGWGPPVGWDLGLGQQRGVISIQTVLTALAGEGAEARMLSGTGVRKTRMRRGDPRVESWRP